MFQPGRQAGSFLGVEHRRRHLFQLLGGGACVDHDDRFLAGLAVDDQVSWGLVIEDPQRCIPPGEV